jgi:hypothetical protein
VQLPPAGGVLDDPPGVGVVQTRRTCWGSCCSCCSI